MKDFLQKIVVSFFLLQLLSSCGMNDLFESKKNQLTKLESIKLIREDGSNSNKYVRVDIAFIYNTDFIENLMPTTPKDWFDKYSSYSSFDTNIISIQTYEPIPMKMMDHLVLPQNFNASYKVMIYVAYYDADKYFEFDVTEYKNLQIKLSGENVYVTDRIDQT